MTRARCDMPMILILGSKKDANIKLLSNRLETRDDCRHAVLDYQNSSFAFEMSAAGEFTLVVEGETVTGPVAIFDRVLLLKRTEYYPAGEESEADFVADEYRALFNLLAELYGDKVVNSLSSRRCLVKPYQQRAAAVAGFLVPDTIISNQKAALVRFSDQTNDHLIIKPLANGMLYPNDQGGPTATAILTNRIARKDLVSAADDDLEYSPSFLQREILKLYELRVVYVNGQIFAFRIDSQTHARSETDWRRMSHRLGYFPCTLDRDVEEKVRTFMSIAGFTFGSLDIVVDVGEKLWFLECNNQGVWAWLDAGVDGAITEAIADYLVELARS